MLSLADAPMQFTKHISSLSLFLLDHLCHLITGVKRQQMLMLTFVTIKILNLSVISVKYLQSHLSLVNSVLIYFS